MRLELFLKSYKPFCKLAHNFVRCAFKLFLCVRQFFANWNALRTVLFTFAAADTVGSGGRCFSKGGTHDVFLRAGKPAFAVQAIVCGKGARDVDIFRAGYTVTAARAADFHFSIDGV